jgi:hypothetical protein
MSEKKAPMLVWPRRAGIGEAFGHGPALVVAQGSQDPVSQACQVNTSFLIT